jgi:hypothetical protein
MLQIGTIRPGGLGIMPRRKGRRRGYAPCYHVLLSEKMTALAPRTVQAKAFAPLLYMLRLLALRHENL